MKNKIVFFLAVIVSFFTVNVNAEELNTLYPIDNVISIQTKNFSYNEMKFNSGLKDKNGYPVISFGSITNNSKNTKPIPISIDILMFDSNQKNIGFITYCSEKDLDTDYSGAVIRQNESLPFNLSIVKKYFVKEKSYSDIAYFSVLDDNEYCKVGAYDKYEGLTYEEIKNGITKTEKSPADKINDLVFSLGAGVGFIAVFIFILLFVYIIYGVILNALYKRMFAEKTVLAYLPFTNIYITIKLAFGSMIAKIYMIVYFLSFGLVFLHLEILTAILSLVSGLAFIIVIIKLITGKYDLLYYEPSVNNTNNNINTYNNFNNSNNYTNNVSNNALDLSYSNKINDSSMGSNISIGSGTSIGIGNSNDGSENSFNQDNSFGMNNGGFSQNNSSSEINNMFNDSTNNMDNSSNSLNNMFNGNSNTGNNISTFDNNSNNNLNDMFNSNSSNSSMLDNNSSNTLNNMFNGNNDIINNNSMLDSNLNNNSSNSLNNTFNNDLNSSFNMNTINNSSSSSSLFNHSSNNSFNVTNNSNNNLTDDLYNDINNSDDDSDSCDDDGNSDLSNMFR